MKTDDSVYCSPDYDQHRARKLQYHLAGLVRLWDELEDCEDCVKLSELDRAFEGARKALSELGEL